MMPQKVYLIYNEATTLSSHKILCGNINAKTWQKKFEVDSLILQCMHLKMLVIRRFLFGALEFHCSLNEIEYWNTIKTLSCLSWSHVNSY